jgi:hypothetical protein
MGRGRGTGEGEEEGEGEATGDGRDSNGTRVITLELGGLSGFPRHFLQKDTYNRRKRDIA